jgi:hypothetical protein
MQCPVDQIDLKTPFYEGNLEVEEFSSYKENNFQESIENIKTVPQNQNESINFC